MVINIVRWTTGLYLLCRMREQAYTVTVFDAYCDITGTIYGNDACRWKALASGIISNFLGPPQASQTRMRLVL